MHRFRVVCLTLCLATALITSGATPPQSLEGALEQQRARLEKDPTDAGAMNDLGNLLRLAGRLDEAADAYKKAIDLDSSRPTPHYNLALILVAQDKHRAALKELRTVTTLDPGHAWAHYQIGAILDHQGNEDDALDAYARAFVLNPDLASGKTNPQVIENRLLTSALLQAGRESAQRQEAPNAYEDPARIRALLVPSLPSEDAEASAASSAPATGASSEAERSAANRPPATTNPTPGARGPRVLSEESLEPNRQAGQVRQQGAGQRGAAPRGGVRNPGASGGNTASGTWSWPGGQGASGRAQPGAGGGVAGRPGTVGQPRVVLPGGQPQPRIVQPGAPGQVNNPGTPAGYGTGVSSTGRAGNQVTGFPVD